MQGDSGRCWLVLFSSFSIRFLVYGFAYSIGVFYDEFLDVFGESNGMTAWISSLNSGVLCGIGPVGSFLIDKYGCRVAISVGALISFASFVASSFAMNVYFLWISLGVCAGSGFGISYLGANVVISRFFSKYRAMAMGISATGSAIGTFVFPLLKRFWISQYSWNGTLLLCAAVHLHTVAAALLIPSKAPLDVIEATSTPKRKWKKVGKSFLKNKGFTLLCINNFLSSFGLFVVYTHMPSYARSLGHTKFFASFLISLSGIASLVGRLVLAGAVQLKLLLAPTCYSIAYFIAGCGTILSGFWTSKAGIIVSICTFGFFSSAYGALSSEVTCVIAGVQDLSKAYGIIMLACSIGILLGAPLAGFIYDFTRFYPASFYLGGTCLIVSALVLSPVFLKCWRFNSAKKSNTRQTSETVFADNGKGCQNFRHSEIKDAESAEKQKDLVSMTANSDVNQQENKDIKISENTEV